MRWYKHYSSARSDEKISALEDLTGIEGYGFYFKMLEVIAEVMDASDNCSVTYSLNRWGRQLNITSKKFLTLSQRCADVGLMSVCRAGDNFTITTPNLLKYRDNHTKNLQATNKQDKEIDKEEEIDKESISNTKVLLVTSDAVDCPHTEIIKLYAELLPELPQPRIWEGQRKKNLIARWKWVLSDLKKHDKPDTREDGIDFFRRMFVYISKSDFLMGRSEKWSAELGWIVKAENFAKIIQGNYENKEK